MRRSASEYHWPHLHQVGDGLGSAVWGTPGDAGALSFQLLYSLLAGPNHTMAQPGHDTATGNVYTEEEGPMGGPWPMKNDDYGLGNQVQVPFDQSHAFWDAVLGYSYREQNMRAMVNTLAFIIAVLVAVLVPLLMGVF